MAQMLATDFKADHGFVAVAVQNPPPGPKFMPGRTVDRKLPEAERDRRARRWRASHKRTYSASCAFGWRPLLGATYCLL
jgi:hypothetical protein